MKLHLCGALAAMIMLAGCGQTGPLVLPPKADAVESKTRDKPAVTVQPPAPLPPDIETPTSGVYTGPSEPVKGTP